ncbi:hypothetical protein BDF14DRAFT_1909432 [Spinellus fusiger]|nr:hypothetical protein BDF14DRAFT_1909432 [Spinellus fusiger]
MRFAEKGPTCELWLEGTFDLKTRLDEKVEQLPKALEFFFWMMKCLQQSEIIRELEIKHKEALKKYRFASSPTRNHPNIINPSILKLNEKEDKSGMGKLSPFLFFIINKSS